MRGKLRKKTSTKAERVFAEGLKNLRIPYQAKVTIKGREIDFLIGRFAIEINGHPQKLDKNSLLLENGYIPINYTNKQVLTEREDLIIRLLCHNQT